MLLLVTQVLAESAVGEEVEVWLLPPWPEKVESPSPAALSLLQLLPWLAG